jgi:hypothetical protein
VDLLRYDVVDVFTTVMVSGGAAARMSVFDNVNRVARGEPLALP